MKKQISSELTQFLRWTFGIMFVVVGTASVVSLVTLKASFGVLVAPIVIWLVVGGLFVRWIWSCRRVEMTDDGLVVGPNDRVVRFAEIARVTRTYLSRPAIVTLHLDSGERIRFFAPYQFIGWSMPPIVTELVARSTQARAGRTSLPVARSL